MNEDKECRTVVLNCSEVSTYLCWGPRKPMTGKLLTGKSILPFFCHPFFCQKLGMEACATSHPYSIVLKIKADVPNVVIWDGDAEREQLRQLFDIIVRHYRTLRFLIASLISCTWLLLVLWPIKISTSSGNNAIA